MRKAYLTLLFSSTVVFYSCHKTSDHVSHADSPVDVYAAGYEQNGPVDSPSTLTFAKYWKNGKAVSLGDGIHWSAATSIAVSGNDVYVAGSEYNTAGIEVAEYWKNGIKVTLGDGTVNTTATAIVVSGSDVYVSGYARTDDYAQAIYWKNGQAVYLTDHAYSGVTYAYAYAIAVSGNDVYVAGIDEDRHAVYWKNGVKVILGANDPNMPNGTATSIVVSGNDVYAAGMSAVAPVSPGGAGIRAAVWKNGFATYLFESSNETFGYGLAVSGSDIIVAGRNGYQNKYNAVYWKNGAATKLTSDVIDYESATAVAVSDSDVYIAGYGFKGKNHVARYWKNGTAVDLSDGTYEAVANSIFLAKQ